MNDRIEQIRERLETPYACACLGNIGHPQAQPGECNCQTVHRVLREELAALEAAENPRDDSA